MMIKKPKHKLNGGNGATLCIKCSVVICTGLKDILYYDNCKKKVMTPKQKAEELFNKMDMIIYTDQDADSQCKRCALIAVNEVLEALDLINEKYNKFGLEYYQQVKEEIEKL